MIGIVGQQYSIFLFGVKLLQETKAVAVLLDVLLLIVYFIDADNSKLNCHQPGKPLQPYPAVMPEMHHRVDIEACQGLILFIGSVSKSFLSKVSWLPL